MQVDDYAEADCREVNPPIRVESATWSAGGQLDWWVKERREWWGECGVQMAVSGGSPPLIYVEPRRLIDKKAATADTRRCAD
jgi:hypothetical protein